MTFAVAGGGRISGSFIARLPRLSSELGPVAAQSYRLASRIANMIGAGHPVKSFKELNDSPLILISAPLRGVAAIVTALAEAVNCNGKVILSCDSGADSRQLAALKTRGASVGSMHPIPGFDGRRFVIEGDRLAIREATNIARQLGAKVEEVQTAKMGVYTAGLSFGSALFTPLIEASVQCFEDAGMSKASAVRVAEALFQSSLRGYSYAGKRSWTGPLSQADWESVRAELEALSASNPLLERYYREASSVATKLLDGKAVGEAPGVSV